MRKTFILPIVLGIILMTAAASAGFALVSEKASIDVCRGTTQVLKTEVNGIGDFTAKISGDAKSFTTLVPESFSIESGMQTAYSYINPSSFTKEGEYALLVTVGDGTEEKTEAYVVNVKDCHGSVLTIDSSSKTSCPCENITYRLTLENMGQYTETFDLTMGGTGKKWANLSENMTTLGAGEMKDFSIKMALPCSLYGKYGLEFMAKSRNSLSYSSAKTELEIKPCYEYDVKFDQEKYTLCENKEVVVPFSILNSGTAKNIFKMLFDGPKWSALSNDTAEVASGENSTVNITLNPPKGSSGEYALDLDAMSGIGSVGKKASAKVKVEKCYMLSLDASGAKDICDLSKDYSYDVTVKNTGKADEEINLSIEGPEWVSLENSQIRVSAGNELKTKILVQLPEEVEFKEYKIKVTAVSENGAEGETSTEINIGDDEECYTSEMSSSKDDLLIGLEHGKTITYTLKNNGLAKAIYGVTLEGDNSTLFSIINPSNLEIAPGKEGKMYLYVSPPLFTPLGDYSLKVIAKVKGTDIEMSKNLTMKVVESANDTEPGSIVKENWFKRMWNKIVSFFKKPFEKKEQKSEENKTEEAGLNETEELEEVNETVAVELLNESVSDSDANGTLAEELNETAEAKEILEAENNETAAAELLNDTAAAQESKSNETKIGFFRSILLKIKSLGAKSSASDSNVTANATKSEAKANVTGTENINETVEVEKTDETEVKAEAPEVNETNSESENASSTEKKAVLNATEKNNATINLEDFVGAEPTKSFNFQDYKYHIMAAIFTILIIAVLASGWLKKALDFFDED